MNGSRTRTWVSGVVTDLALAARSLWRQPVLTCLAAGTLAVGLGATTAVFALANWMMIRPTPGVRAPDEVVVVRFSPDVRFVRYISHANVVDLHAASPALAELTAHARRQVQTVAFDGRPFELSAVLTAGDYWRALGVQPRVGRTFSPDELAPHATGLVTVISHRVWLSHYGGRQDAIGSTIYLNGEPYTIIGVAPADFHGTDRTSATDVWVPLPAYRHLWRDDVDLADRTTAIFPELIGRLAPGATAVVAEQQLRSAMRALVERFPEANAAFAENLPTVHSGIGLPVAVRAQTRRTLGLMLGLVSLLLLTACANVASLLLYRSLASRSEHALKLALGASTARLARQQAAEAMLLALLGAAAAVALATVLRVLFRGEGLLGLPAVESIGFDWRVFGFAVAAALLAAVLATLGPTLSVARLDSAELIRSGSGRLVGRTVRIRRWLTTVQIGTALALAVAALLLVRTVQNLNRVELGYDAEAVLAFGYDPAPQGHTGAAARALRRRLLEEVSAVPGFRHVGAASFLQVPGDRPIYMLAVPGSGREPLVALGTEVSDGYFAALGVPVIAGRTFTSSEQHMRLSESPGVVLGRSTARSLFGDTPAVGRIVEVGGFRGSTTHVVLGVVGDVRSHARGEPELAVYLPLGAAFVPQGFLLVRSDLPRARTEDLVRDVLARIDPAIPFFRTESLADAQQRANAEERLLARLLGVFATLSIVLALVGLYGVITYSVERRRREIAVRVALGAPQTRVLAMITGETLRLVCAGAVAGVVGGYAISRVLAHRIFDIAPFDAVTYAAAIIGFTLVALLASAIPARTAARISPLQALRHD